MPADGDYAARLVPFDRLLHRVTRLAAFYARHIQPEQRGILPRHAVDRAELIEVEHRRRALGVARVRRELPRIVVLVLVDILPAQHLFAVDTFKVAHELDGAGVGVRVDENSRRLFVVAVRHLHRGVASRKRRKAQRENERSRRQKHYPSSHHSLPSPPVDRPAGVSRPGRRCHRPSRPHA